MSAGGTRARSSYPLRALLLWLVVGILLPALLVGAFLVRRAVRDNQDFAQRRLLEAAHGAAALVDAEFSATIRTLQALAQSEWLRRGDLTIFRDEAVRLKTTQPSWYAVVLLQPDGQQLINTARAVGEPLPAASDPQSLDKTVETRQPVIGNLTRGNGEHQRMAFAIRIPVIVDDRVRYVLSAVITPEGLADTLRVQESLSSDWTRGILDTNFAIVARTHDQEQYVGRKGTPQLIERASKVDNAVFENVTLDGRRVYSAFSRAPRSRWIAGVAVSRSLVDGAFGESMAALGVIGVLLLGLGGLGSYWISRWIARDISRVTDAADAIAAGQEPVMPDARVTEVRHLVDALTRSSELIKARERERDERVSRSDAARAEAEAADRAKDEFLAMLSHELRNPLAPALNALHLAKIGGGAFATREREIVERQVRHMARLVDDLLEMSRLRHGPIELRRDRFDVATPISQAVEMTAPVLDEKGHQLVVQVAPGLVVDGDELRIAQVVTNLLSNAAKYTEPGGHISLEAQRSGDEVVITCSDDGIGMSPALVPRVFDPFVQGERGIDRRQGGLGLGLAVVRTIVQLHGGTVVADSKGSGAGSTFTLRLPLSEGPPDLTPAMGLQLESRPLSGRVLVVEDGQDARDMLVLSLTIAGLDTRGVGRASEAIREVEAWQPELGVLDIGLPDMDGFDLARELRRRPSGANMKLIALTGYGGEANTTAAREAGFDLYLIKPVGIDLLLERIDDLLRAGRPDRTPS